MIKDQFQSLGYNSTQKAQLQNDTADEQIHQQPNDLSDNVKNEHFSRSDSVQNKETAENVRLFWCNIG